MGDPEVDLRTDFDLYTEEMLRTASPRCPVNPKVIHDPIWGTHQFLPHEIAIIDSPLLQRLRRIYQLGLSFFTFPSTTQSRFEHSLGATIVAGKMLEVIARRHPERLDVDPYKGDLAQVRAAALLHDCGHGFASHASEQVYKWHPSVVNAKTATEKFLDVKASELFSWFVITSPAFKAYLEEINRRCGSSLNPEVIADLILGFPYDDRDFIAEVLNGPFDVDRVDYIVRDSDYSGIKAGIDLERFFHDIDISMLQDGRLHLVLHSTHAIEQILWTKVHLFVRLYRHQKVLAADGAIQSLPSLVQSTKSKFNGIDFSRASDFLRVTDADILGANPEHLVPELRRLIQNFHQRTLPHRCITVTRAALRSPSASAGIRELQRFNEDPEESRLLRTQIWEKILEKRRPDLNSIIISFPLAPPLREASQVYVLPRGNTDPVTLSSLFRIDDWLTTYNESHWAGFIFSDFQDVEVVCDAALQSLAERGIEIDRVVSTSSQRRWYPTIAPKPQVPLTPQEPFYHLTPRLPVLETFVQTELAGRQPFKDLYAVLILHFLTDLPPLLERLVTLGLDPRKTWLVRKPYRYAAVDKIMQYLRGKGYRIEECTAAEGTEEPARRVLQDVRSMLTGDMRFFVIEDGGYVTPMLHSEDFIDLRERCIGVVEQTTKGLREIRKIQKAVGLRLPVVAVADSKLKLALEASEVGEALAFALETYYRRTLGIPLTGISTLVIGFGAVGRNLAHALRNRGARVSVYDREFDRRVEATAQKPVGFDSPESLDKLPFKLIVGTTGGTSLTVQTLLTAEDGVILASGSSDRLEFDLEGIREHISEPVDENILLEGLITRYRLKNGRSIRLLCEGYPINFIIGDGIAKSVIDPILTQLLAGAALICEKKITEPNIHNVPSSLEENLWTLYRKLTMFS